MSIDFLGLECGDLSLKTKISIIFLTNVLYIKKTRDLRQNIPVLKIKMALLCENSPQTKTLK